MGGDIFTPNTVSEVAAFRNVTAWCRWHLLPTPSGLRVGEAKKTVSAIMSTFICLSRDVELCLLY